MLIPSELSDQALLVFLQVLDNLRGAQDLEENERDAKAVEAEVNRRFGDGAVDAIAEDSMEWRSTFYERLQDAVDKPNEVIATIRAIQELTRD